MPATPTSSQLKTYMDSDDHAVDPSDTLDSTTYPGSHALRCLTRKHRPANCISDYVTETYTHSQTTHPTPVVNVAYVRETVTFFL